MSASPECLGQPFARAFSAKPWVCVKTEGTTNMLLSTKNNRHVRTDSLLSEQLARLQHADLVELRDGWREAFGISAPVSLRRGMLARALAYRLQAQVYGDVRLGGALVRDGTPLSAAKPAADGVKLIRSWRGELHEVEAQGARFVYRGETWRSLSAIAREITGTKWNGLTFFGVKDREDLSRSVRRG